ncbi:hypothetical protein, partial [Klebsiella pneumoniae]|uniref:hypothetical protein n=1 Tax=Klebsiella pneumoniae TaxID=573 RepID=UPI0022B9EAAF
MDNRSKAADWLSTSDHVNLPGSVLEMALLATIKDGTDPFIQFDGAELTEEQRPMFESLVVETHAL